jgi:hypothetical protein
MVPSLDNDLPGDELSAAMLSPGMLSAWPSWLAAFFGCGIDAGLGNRGKGLSAETFGLLNRPDTVRHVSAMQWDGLTPGLPPSNFPAKFQGENDG